MGKVSSRLAFVFTVVPQFKQCCIYDQLRCKSTIQNTVYVVHSYIKVEFLRVESTSRTKVNSAGAAGNLVDGTNVVPTLNSLHTNEAVSVYR